MGPTIITKTFSNQSKVSLTVFRGHMFATSLFCCVPLGAESILVIFTYTSCSFDLTGCEMGQFIFDRFIEFLVVPEYPD